MKHFFFILLFFVAVYPASAQENNTKHPNEADVSADKQGTLPIDLYQTHLSPILGGKCPMYPSCSQYSKDAINKHGLLLGWFMTCDRLMRCGRDEVTQSRHVKIDHYDLCYDPVSKNDFWLK